MSWLKSILNGGKADEKTLTLRLCDIGPWLEERSISPRFEERQNEIYNLLNEVSEDLRRELESLAAAEADGATPSRLLRAGLTGRSEILKQMRSLSERLQPPAGRDIESAAAYHWTLLKGLERTVTTFGRAQRYTAAIFPEDMKRIDSDLARVGRLLVDLEAEIGSRRKELEEIWYCTEGARRVTEEQTLLSEQGRRAREEEERLAGLRGTSARLESEQKSLAGSAEGRQTGDLKNALAQKLQEKARIEAEISDLISPLSKALARISKQGASDRLSLQHRNVFDQLSSSPSQVPDEEIQGALQELRGHLSALGLKDRKKEKTLDHIDHLIKAKALQISRACQIAVAEEIRTLEAAFGQSSLASARLQEEHSRVRKAIRALEADLSRSHQELAALQKRAEQDESELNERLARLAGRQVKVDLD